jgi:hypothetical protein
MTLIKIPLFQLLIICLIIFGFKELPAIENNDNITNFKINPDYIDMGAFF